MCGAILEIGRFFEYIYVCIDAVLFVLVCEDEKMRVNRIIEAGWGHD